MFSFGCRIFESIPQTAGLVIFIFSVLRRASCQSIVTFTYILRNSWFIAVVALSVRPVHVTTISCAKRFNVSILYYGKEVTFSLGWPVFFIIVNGQQYQLLGRSHGCSSKQYYHYGCEASLARAYVP
uniref:Putative secreted protein ovary overexpressed n=2 Tax=Rhipicephalus microplus TaxID=6941 RepID=A0A6M2D971_RHIMP